MEPSFSPWPTGSTADRRRPLDSLENIASPGCKLPREELQFRSEQPEVAAFLVQPRTQFLPGGLGLGRCRQRNAQVVESLFSQRSHFVPEYRSVGLVPILAEGQVL